MSTTSKLRRDLRKRRETEAANREKANASPVEPHAELRDQQRTLLAGAARAAATVSDAAALAALCTGSEARAQ